MKKVFLALVFVVVFQTLSIAQEFKIVTVVESIIPNGIGRSRMIIADDVRDYKDFTTKRSDEKSKDSKNKSKRDEIRLKSYDETKLLNFFNLGGIRFQNIAANDAIVTSMLIDMSKNGWSLEFVNSGVEASAGKGDKNGIYVTRYIFKK